MALNLDISKDLVKEAVCEKLERFQSLPMVMQTLENNGMRNDQLFEQIDFMMEAEFENIEARVAEDIDAETQPEEFKKAVETNSTIYKENLKKVMKLMGKKFKFNEKLRKFGEKIPRKSQRSMDRAIDSGWEVDPISTTTTTDLIITCMNNRD
jgi:hypothetical protein